jgi:hypothetical protein
VLSSAIPALSKLEGGVIDQPTCRSNPGVENKFFNNSYTKEYKRNIKIIQPTKHHQTELFGIG